MKLKNDMASTLDFGTHRIVEPQRLRRVFANDPFKALSLNVKIGSYELSFLVTALVYTFCVCAWCNKRFINYCII